MSDEPSFLTRWSRRKRGVADAVPAQEPPAPAVAAAEEEDIATPPPAETIPLEEIGDWLKKRLPDGWREAALRRVWSADVGIRDYIGPADYQWDFTIPDGVPGWGPMSAADDVAKLLDRVINGTTDLPPPPEPDPEPESPTAAAETCTDSEANIPFAAHNDTSGEARVTLPFPEKSAYDATQKYGKRRSGRATPVFPQDQPE